MSLIQRVAEHPAVYDLVQDLAGRRVIIERFQPWFDRLTGIVLDVGGGTGRISAQLPSSVRYVCVDLEYRRLARFKQQSSDRAAVVADATRLPFQSRSIDAAMLLGVSHHLSAEALDATLSAMSRVLTASGTLFVLEPLWAPRYLPGRALWACDRGAYPRTADGLEAAVRRSFEIEQATSFAVLHQYAAFWCRNRNAV